jgi:uncharacterized protein (TIGR02246 family)
MDYGYAHLMPRLIKGGAVEPIDELSAKQACAELLARYALAVNTRDVDGFVGLFTRDGEWHRPGGHSMRGQDEIREYIDYALADPKERTLRHVNGANVIEIIDADTATSWSQTTVYDTPRGGELPVPLTGPDMVVEYRDRLVRVTGQWYIDRRDTTVVLAVYGVASPPSPRQS